MMLFRLSFISCRWSSTILFIFKFVDNNFLFVRYKLPEHFVSGFDWCEFWTYEACFKHLIKDLKTRQETHGGHRTFNVSWFWVNQLFKYALIGLSTTWKPTFDWIWIWQANLVQIVYIVILILRFTYLKKVRIILHAHSPLYIFLQFTINFLLKAIFWIFNNHTFIYSLKLSS